MKQEAIKEEVEKFCQMARQLNAKTVILFGSRARADYTEESDVDICIIAESLSTNLFERRYLAPEGFRFLSVFGFYPKEFLDMLSGANPFILDIVNEGKVLYDDGFFKKVKETYEAAVRKYKLRKEDRGWRWAYGKSPEHLK